MPKKAMDATMDLQLLDTGKALATVSFVDSIGEATAPAADATVSTSFTSSDAGVIATARPDGLSADVALTSPAPTPLPTGVVITAVTTITNADSSTVGPFTATGNPLDFIAGGPAGITVAESAE